MKNFKAFFESSDDEDYRGSHRAPMKGEGAPLHDVSGVYPDDIYTLPVATAARYYGHAEPSDTEAIYVIQRMKSKPNGTLKIYRAIPDVNKEVNDKLKKLGNYFAYVDKYGFPPIKDELAREIWRESGYDKEKFFDQVRKMIAELDLQKKKPIQINRGDWVTTVRSYAVGHGESTLEGSYKILSKTVPAKHLFTDGNSIYEFGYDPS